MLIEWNPVAATVAAYTARQLAGIGEESATLAAIRDAVAEGAERLLAPLNLTRFFGHVTGVIGAVPPFGAALWETGLVPTGQYNPTNDGQYEGFGGGYYEARATLALVVAVGVLTADLPYLQSQAEAWEIPLMHFVSNNPTFGGTVEYATWLGYTMNETWQWGDTTYYCGIARVACDLIRQPPVPV